MIKINMTENLISFETVKLAKEKGFNEFNLSTSVYIYDNYGELWCDEYNFNELTLGCQDFDDKNLFHPLYYVTSQSLLQKWLREKHKVDIIINPTYGYVIHKNGLNNNRNYIGNYEQALEAALQKSLELII